jgi:hypothetical protein
LVGHNHDTEISTAQLPHHFNNELRTVCESEPIHNTGISPRNQNEQLDGPQKGKIFERRDYHVQRDAHVEPVNGQLRSDAQPNGDTSTPSQDPKLSRISETSSGSYRTAREAGRTCGLPADLCDRQKQRNLLVRLESWWILKTRKDPVARSRARQREWDVRHREVAAKPSPQIRFEQPVRTPRQTNAN